MRLLAIAFLVTVYATCTNMARTGNAGNKNTLVVARERDLDVDVDSSETFNKFVEEKLMQHSQALEHLIKVVDNTGEMIKRLINNLSKGIEKPKLPAKAEYEEVYNINSNMRALKENPILRLGKNIPKYGKLAKDLVMREIHPETDPTPLVEKDLELETLLDLGGTRRSFGGDHDQVLIPGQKDDKEAVNPWCPMALLCQPTSEPLCGFDDVFGYGKFEDLCHMLRVNCYWKYNFSMVHSCQPKL